VTPLDRADLRRWKHTLDYHQDRYGKDKAFTYAFQEYWRWYVMNKTDGMSKEELRKELEER
jgi:hypothetical protein